jgi:hypothetical protein
MTRVLVQCAVLIAAAASARADTLEDASKWPDLVYSAKERGIDIQLLLHALDIMTSPHSVLSFRHTPHTDGSGAESQCVVLRQLLEVLGDQKFSNALRGERVSLRTKVTEALDFDFGHPWQKQFPVTYALGSHHARRLKLHNET